MTPPNTELSEAIRRQVRTALDEDLTPAGDVTAEAIPADAWTGAWIVSRERGVIAGRPWVEAVFAALDERITIDWSVEEGRRVQPNTLLCRLYGPARALVTGERTALNFLQTLSATATLTRAYVDAVAGTDVAILDTRKTLPGLRSAQKYAVRCGGGTNHRMGLGDAVLIKENHIAASGSIPESVTRVRHLHPELPMEVEVESLNQLREAMDAGAERILLDNMDDDTLREAVTIAKGRVFLEASGNMDRERVGRVAQSGVDAISVGALTKDVRALDLSMGFDDLEDA
ncbi:MAG: carboxylating nicotinate-nucleotide diphosphorylase [Pseudomonadota bacterium]